MKRHQPDTLEKSNRSIINRGVGIELHEGRGTKHGGVYLDLSSITPDEISQIGPSIFRVFAKNGIDLTYQPMELAPGAHTFLGGILVQADGSTELEGLYAAGEVAGGIHGANRLGGNAVIDSLVFGDLAGSAAADFVNAHNLKTHSRIEVKEFYLYLKSGLKGIGLPCSCRLPWVS